MNTVRFRMELDEPAQAEQLARLVEQRLAQLEPVAQVQAAPEQPRDLGTVVSAIAGAVAIAKGGTMLIGHLRELVAELKGLVEELDGLRRVVIEVGSREVELGALGDQEFDEIVGATT